MLALYSAKIGRLTRVMEDALRHREYTRESIGRHKASHPHADHAVEEWWNFRLPREAILADART